MVFKHPKRRNWRYYNASRDENHQRRNEINCPSFKVFTLSEIVSLRKVYIVSCSKTNRTKQK